MRRRTALQLLGGGAAAWALRRPLWAAANASSDDYFLFIVASGGWDVTLWSDPRNERKGIIEPPSTANMDPGHIKRWKAATLEDGASTFEPLTPPGSSMRLGPAIGDLYDLHDRITVINGIAMNTVSHDDGTTYSTTGRHRTGGVIPESSIDVLVANELGTGQLMPGVSIKFPSWFTGDKLDRRVIPLRVSEVDAITRAFARSELYLDRDDRVAMTAMLTEEAKELANGSTYPQTYEQLASQHEALPRLLGGEFVAAFSPKQLDAAYPTLHTGPGGQRAAFAVEAIKRNVVRCVAFGFGGFDTHYANYRQHAYTLQGMFDTLAALVKLLDVTPHPTRSSAKLGDHVHIIVLSEFCRTPQVNLHGGRDHYPNNSALFISPRFKGGRVFGSTDPEQLLPRNAGYPFVGGDRPIAPPDVLATFLGAFGIDPRKYMRDGEVIKDMLA